MSPSTMLYFPYLHPSYSLFFLFPSRDLRSDRGREPCGSPSSDGERRSSEGGRGALAADLLLARVGGANRLSSLGCRRRLLLSVLIVTDGYSSRRYNEHSTWWRQRGCCA